MLRKEGRERISSAYYMLLPDRSSGIGVKGREMFQSSACFTLLPDRWNGGGTAERVESKHPNTHSDKQQLHFFALFLTGVRNFT